jgi:hypothetical protein
VTKCISPLLSLWHTFGFYIERSGVPVSKLLVLPKVSDWNLVYQMDSPDWRFSGFPQAVKILK